MRRLTIALSVFSVLGLLGCEDGPSQTFNPLAPDGANNVNDGRTTAFNDPVQQAFVDPNAATTGSNANELCNGPTKAERWSIMVNQPIIPPRFAAGLDTAGNDEWQGLTLEKAEQGFDRVDYDDGFNKYPGEKRFRLCQSEPTGDIGYNVWGDNGEVTVSYNPSNRKIDGMFTDLGYLGAVKVKSRPGSVYGEHTYELPIGSRMKKDGIEATFDWKGEGSAAPPKLPNIINATELYDAFIYTLSPSVRPEDPGVSCTTSAHCIINSFGDTVYWFAPSTGYAFLVQTIKSGDIIASTPIEGQMYKTKSLGFSGADPFLNFSKRGPFASAGKVGSKGSQCDMYMGQTYAHFIDTCVRVTGDPVADDRELQKLLGGIRHGRQRFQFDVQGIDTDFSSEAIGEFDIIRDRDLPDANDIATSFSVEQGAQGKILNDYKDNDPTKEKDLHGSGLVWLEFARLVQIELNKARDPDDASPIRTIGEPACLLPLSTGKYAAGCTGMEAFVTGAPPIPASELPPDEKFLNNVALGGDNVSAGAAEGLATGLVPGQPSAVFCSSLLPGSAPGGCTPAKHGISGPLFATTFDRVVAIYGKGNPQNLPPEMRDRRFMFRHWFRALTKYLLAAGKADAAGKPGRETAKETHEQVVNPDNLFFDSEGAGQFENAEYIDRTYVGNGQVATDLEVTADVKNGILNNYAFSRDFFRGEEALYGIMQDPSKDPGAPLGGDLGGENVLLANMFGSPVLEAAYPGNNDAAYQCAIKESPAKCAGSVPPKVNGPKGSKVVELDDRGLPVLTSYRGAILGSSPLKLGSVGTADSGIRILETNGDLLSATVEFPAYLNPYDVTKGFRDPNNPTFKKLIPWFSKQPGIGFNIPVSGTINRFISTAELSMTGTTLNANVNYDYEEVLVADGNGGKVKQKQLVFKAVESATFLGYAFLCQDPATKDILKARMYDALEYILDWLETHPMAKTSCDIIIRYSQFNNFADYISSLSAGVTLGITQGGGYGRINDIVVWTPGLLALPCQVGWTVGARSFYSAGGPGAVRVHSGP